MLNIITFKADYLESSRTNPSDREYLTSLEEGVPLETYPDTELTIIWENPLFMIDEISVAFSLSFEAPASPSNLNIFNHPERIAIKNPRRSVPAVILQDGVVLAKGELLLEGFFNELSLQFKGAIDIIYKEETLRQVDMGQQDFDVSFPFNPEDQDSLQPLNYNAPEWENYISTIAQRASTMNAGYYAVGVVKKDGEEWDKPEHEGYRGIVNSYIKYINYYRPHTGAPWFSFYVPQRQVTTLRTVSPIIPFPRLGFILWKIFQSNDQLLTNNPFTSGDLANLIIIGQNHPKYNLDNLYKIHYDPGGQDEVMKEVFLPVTDSEGHQENMFWRYQNFMQEFGAIDFIKEILKIFSATLYREGLEYKIELNNDIMERDVVVSWDDKIEDGFEVSTEKGKNYSFSYTGTQTTPDDTIFEYDTIQEMHDAIMEYPDTPYLEELYYKVKGHPQVFQIKKELRGFNSPGTDDQDGHPWLYSKIIKSGLSPKDEKHWKKYKYLYEGDIVIYENQNYLVLLNHETHPDSPPNETPDKYKPIPKKDDQLTITSEIKPLEMNIERYWMESQASYQPHNNVIRRRHWYVPLLPKTNKESPPNIMFHAGMKPALSDFATTGNYPFITNHNIDAQGNKIFDFSLLPGVKDGIEDVLHKKMKEWVERDKLKIRAYITLSAQEIRQMNIRDKIYVRGKKFYIKTIQFTLSNKGISKSDVELIEI